MAAAAMAAACMLLLWCLLVPLTWAMAMFFPPRAQLQQPSEEPSEERARQGEAMAKQPLEPAEQRELWPAGSPLADAS